MQASVVSIITAPATEAPAVAHESVEALAGRGIPGDRYFDGLADPAKWAPDQEITLIEEEEIQAFNAANGTAFTAGDLRRNIVTRGVGLNDLVDREFRVGTAVLRGHRLCEPCAYLAGRTDERILKGMLHKAGLRAEIVTSGTISVGDAIDIG